MNKFYNEALHKLEIEIHKLEIDAHNSIQRIETIIDVS